MKLKFIISKRKLVFHCRISMLLIGLSFAFTIQGQSVIPNSKLLTADSILLKKFWVKFKTSVETKDKVKLESLCQFPFYCRPCIDDTTLKRNNHITIKVTKEIFLESQYKIFFDRPICNEVIKHKQFDKNIFKPATDEKNKRNGFMFSYTIVAPSNKWEGSQGIIYLRKINGKYKITGIDTVP